jgi:MYXO-CTERM domain-containing protein
MLALLFLAAPARAADSCAAWEVSPVAAFTSREVGESSGVAMSADGLHLYTVEDAGNDAVLHIFGTDGAYVGAQGVRGATNTDWEDLAAGPCPGGVDAERCLWVADIGDNDESRETVSLWVVAQSLDAAEDAVECRFTYPGGRVRDAEALLVSPAGEVRIVSKENDGQAHVYLARAPRCDGSVEPLVEEAELSVPEPITGGATSADGTTIVLRGASEALVWRDCAVDWTVEPERIDLGSQEQGEAIAFGPEDALVTTSEGDPMRAWYALCAGSAPVPCEADEGCGCASGDARHGAGAALLGLALVAGLRGRRYRPGQRGSR